MDEVIADILDALRAGELNQAALDALLRKHSARLGVGEHRIAKKQVIPAYLALKARGDGRWEKLGVTDELEERFFSLMKMKPRRTASGVATITVITKPWPCQGNCIFCPSDVRMPKSYLHDEPACQRAERSFFDPYLQVASRLQALQAMGHATDKVELIVLGGTWTDYPEAYRLWFVASLFDALNDSPDERKVESQRRSAQYRAAGMANDAAALEQEAAPYQHMIDLHASSYNEELARFYAAEGAPWQKAALWQRASWDEVERQQRENETSAHRVVGLVVETRPDAISAASLRELRALGCTKVQMGIQSLYAEIRDINGRPIAQAKIEEAFALCRLFGFKSHVHQMVNLKGATPQSDRDDYRMLVSDVRFQPDEVKLYPCALIGSAQLEADYQVGSWVPYGEEELVQLLVDDVMTTPPYARISRMIRDFSSGDIVAGNKKANLRQMVEGRIAEDDLRPVEIRYREVGTSPVEVDALTLNDFTYATSVSEEHFLQWVTPEGRIAGFLRLSLPASEAIERYAGAIPVGPGEAMIREVHVYGFAAPLQREGTSAQHHGLGRKLIERACEIAKANGYEAVNVISAVGTREYYRKLGFADNGLYQQKSLS